MTSYNERINEAVDTCEHVKELLPSFAVYMDNIKKLIYDLNAKLEDKQVAESNESVGIVYEFKGGRYRRKRVKT